MFWQSGVVQLWPGDIFNCVSCFLVKKHAVFKWKDAISGFPVSLGSAEALVRWGGKIKYLLIAYFLGNISAKNCRNRTVYVKIIAVVKVGHFFRHSVVIKLWTSKTSFIQLPVKNEITNTFGHKRHFQITVGTFLLHYSIQTVLFTVTILSSICVPLALFWKCYIYRTRWLYISLKLKC